MATLHFTIDEARNVLWANNMIPDSVRDIRAEANGLLVTVAGGIEIAVRQDSFAQGILKLKIESGSWAFKLADSLGKVDSTIDNAIRPYPFLRREGKALIIDLNLALQGRAKGFQVKNFVLREGEIKVDF